MDSKMGMETPRNTNGFMHLLKNYTYRSLANKEMNASPGLWPLLWAILQDTKKPSQGLKLKLDNCKKS